jgi:hypothetical protein
MIKASQFALAAVQTVIFTPPTVEFSQPKLLTSILLRFAERFNGPMVALPVSEAAGAVGPQVVLQSADSIWRLLAAPMRVDSLWVGIADQSTEPGLAAQSATQDIIARCSEVLEHYVQTNNIPVIRLALVLTRICETAEPARLLIERFCNDEAKAEPFRNSKNFEIHNHKRYLLQSANAEINSWVRCRTALLLQKPVVLVEQDLNTPEEEFRQPPFHVDEIREYYQKAASEADDVLRLYFPDEK